MGGGETASLNLHAPHLDEFGPAPRAKWRHAASTLVKMTLHNRAFQYRRSFASALLLLVALGSVGVYGVTMQVQHSGGDATRGMAAIPYQNTKPGVAYVGSQACGRCHVSIYENYRATDMARSMSLPPQCAALKALHDSVTVYDPKHNQYFAVFPRGSGFYETEYAVDAAGKEIFRHTERIAYVMGTGENGIGFLIQRGSYLFEGPLAFFARTKSWALSPGYASNDFGFSRPITADCAVCHAGLPQPVPDRTGRYENPPFRELGIGCEDCHGPGQLHVERRLKGDVSISGIDDTIVNPAQLPGWLADNICMSCHEEGDARVLQPGKQYVDFRPGTPLDNTIAVFDLPLERQSNTTLALLGYYSEMTLSKCFRGSHGRLSCLTCHNPHQQLGGRAAIAYYRSKCLACHTDKSCGLSLERRRQETIPDNCLECHMPKQPAKQFAHTVITDHRILARRGEPLPLSAFPSSPSQLVYVDAAEGQNGNISPLLLLDAYLQILLNQPSPEYDQLYARTLAQAEKTNPNSVIILRALAKIAVGRGTPEGRTQAIQYLERIAATKLATPDDDFALGEQLAIAGRADEGIPILQKAVPSDPYNPLGYEALAIAYLAAGRYPDAADLVQKALKLFPENRILRILLSKIPAVTMPPFGP
jgi:tetratricopeptide (TPR) repeat protein